MAELLNASSARAAALPPPPRNADRTATSLAYRAEIDGLRTVAVVPVVLFHAGLTMFSGGFIGVDIFFVISGYLITSILLNDLALERYSIARFYERRARRILPALFVVLLACLPFAWIGLVPDEFRAFSKSILAVLGFVSNVSFWLEEGYFAQASELKPLLHTWSLAVEEQFYVLFPLMLLILRRTGLRTITLVIAVAAAASFALCEYAAYHFQTANFFLAPTRAWELLAGALCACVGRKHHLPGAAALAAAGLVLILGGIVMLDETQVFPSHFAMIPVLGTVLLILFSESGSGAGRLLALPPFVGIGLISYSLYLWHQPLFAFARLMSFGRPSMGMMLGLCLVAVVLAAATWRFVEQPFRKATAQRDNRRHLAFALGTAAALALFGVFGVITQGAPWRLGGGASPQVRLFTAAAREPQPPQGDCRAEEPASPCRLFPAPGAPARVMVIGDSHAIASRAAFADLARSGRAEVYYIGHGGCPPLLGAYIVNGNAEPDYCLRLASATFAQARQLQVAAVFLVARWTLYAEGDPLGSPTKYIVSRTPYPFRPDRAGSRSALAGALHETVAAYRAAGIRVILVEQVPQQATDLKRYAQWLNYRPPANGLAAAIAEHSIPVRDHLAFQHRARAMLLAASGPGVTVLDPDTAFLNGGRMYWGNPSHGSWYGDDNHISPTGARRLAPLMTAGFDTAMREHVPPRPTDRTP